MFIKNLLIFIYLFAPKINLINFSGLPTGIRTQDLIALIMFIIVMKRIQINFKWAIWLLFSLFNIYVGLINGNNFVIISWIRIFEYYLVGYFIYEGVSYQLIKSSINLNLIIGLMQYLLIVPNYDAGRGIIYSNQYSGLFSNPAEFSYGILLLIFIANLRPTFGFLIIFNGVKTAFLNIIYYSYRYYFKKIKFLHLIISLILFLLLNYYFNFFNLIYNFINAVTSINLSNLNLLENKNYTLYVDVGDASLSQRVVKWGISFNLITDNLFSFFFGYGLFAAGSALDGGILRLFLEIGVFPSVLLFLIMFKNSYNFFIIFIFTNTFFDGWINSTIAPLLISFYLFNYDRSRKK
jgi:hypothetical protein